jgi:molybdopterin-guanine dinucleotide biosynthesis protein A
MKVEVCILAGGKSSRMGQPKSAMHLEGSPLLNWSRRIAQAAGLPYRVIDRDLTESRGPISGIQTALKTTRAEAVIFLSCDMPFVRSSTLRQLITQRRSAFALTNEGVGFPFILSKNTTIDTDSLQSLARKLNATKLKVTDEESFNINTPADFKKAERLLANFNKRTILDVDSLSIRRGKL